MLDNIIDGKSPSIVRCANEVTDIPKTFVRWARDNTERMERAKAKGTLPYFYKDNERRITDALNGKRYVKKPLSKEQKERRKVIQKIAFATLVGKQIALPQIGATATLSNGKVKEWLNQPFDDVDAKNEALLEIESLMANAEYKGFVADKHDPCMKAHIFEVVLSGKQAWVIVREIYKEGYKIHSIMDSDKLNKMLE